MSTKLHRQLSDHSHRARAQSVTHYRTSSLDRGTKLYLLRWRAESFRINASGIPETNPQDTQELWEHIREKIKTTPPEPQVATSHSSGRTKGRNPENEGSTVTLSDQSESFEVSSKPSEMTVSRPKPFSPASKSFCADILTPRRITFEAPLFTDVYEHFNTPEPDSARTRIEHFQRVRNVQHTVVWLEPAKGFIAEIVREYECMRNEHESEAEFAAYAIEAIFKNDPRCPTSAFNDSNRGWRTQRRLQVVDKPSDANEEYWRPPPLISIPSDATEVILPADSTSQRESPSTTSKIQYEFDICTDCAYYLSTQGFNIRHLYKIQMLAHVIKDNSMCPYLTIEFKKDSSSSEAANNQLVAAAALALYNRFLLRQARLKRREEKFEGQHQEDLKHYGITFEGPEYSVWCITPCLVATDDRTQVQWKGCTMRQISVGVCYIAPSVEELIDWINEIHAWGLDVHAFGVENDVKLLLGATTKSTRRMSAAHESIDTWRSCHSALAL